MKFSAFASTTSLLALAVVVKAQAADPVIPLASSSINAAVAGPITTAITDASVLSTPTGSELSVTGTETATATATDLAGAASSIASQISSQVSVLATSTAIAGAAPGAAGSPGAPGAPGSPGAPGTPGAPAGPVSSLRPTVSMQTSGFSTGTAVRPSFFPSLTPSATSTNAAPRSHNVASQSMFYAFLGVIVATLF